MKKILNTDWVFYGRWKEKPLNIAYWVANKDPQDKKFDKYRLFLANYLYLNGYYYVSKKDIDFINKNTRTIIESGPYIFRKLFKDIEEVFIDYIKLSYVEKNEFGLLNFLEKNKDIHFFWRILSFLNIGITSYLEEESKKFNVNYFNYISLNKKTILMKERDEFNKLYLSFKKKNDNFEKLLNFYLKYYAFMGTFVFEGNPQTKNSVIKRLKSFKLKKEPKKIIPNDNFFKKYKEIIKIASAAAYYRMNCAELFAKISYSFWPAISKIAEKNKLSFGETVHYAYYELEELIKNKKNIDIKLIKERQKCFGMFKYNDEPLFLSKKDTTLLLKKLSTNLKNVTTLKGMPVSRGYARGEACIVKEIKEINKIKKGDILVAFETTPDFILAIKKASAIITEQGGITSHAAIVSREMHKPCVVGIKNITRILKDGDLIEVDANNGIVKILKKAK